MDKELNDEKKKTGFLKNLWNKFIAAIKGEKTEDVKKLESGGEISKKSEHNVFLKGIQQFQETKLRGDLVENDNRETELRGKLVGNDNPETKLRGNLVGNDNPETELRGKLVENDNPETKLRGDLIEKNSIERELQEDASRDADVSDTNEPNL